jgi:hypothetical protein
MKSLYLLPLCMMIATSASAQTLEFRGEFLGTYMADAGFLDSLPAGTRLNCEEQLCSSSKAVRIYVFSNSGKMKRFWSTDYSDVMFDEPEKILSCGKEGHIVYYDENNQLLLRDHLCHRETAEPARESVKRSILSYLQETRDRKPE